MQTILGSGGAIGIPLAKELLKYTDKIRLVSRNPVKVNHGDELLQADLLDLSAVKNAVKGSDVVYLAAGLKYESAVWQKEWPLVMTNTINACKESGSRLLFIDNVYSYGKVTGWMTEETPYNPISKKGEIRARIAQQLENEYKTGNLNAVIFRGADFYGPAVRSGIFNILVLQRMNKGKRANWLGNPDKKHSFTYNIDMAKGAALIGNSESAFNQVWHAPTHPDALSGREMIFEAAAAMNKKPEFSSLNKFTLYVGGLFDKTVKELIEMYYQNDSDYLFDSTKFNSYFNFSPTPYKNGIIESVKNT